MRGESARGETLRFRSRRRCELLARGEDRRDDRRDEDEGRRDGEREGERERERCLDVEDVTGRLECERAGAEEEDEEETAPELPRDWPLLRSSFPSLCGRSCFSSACSSRARLFQFFSLRSVLSFSCLFFFAASLSAFSFFSFR